MNIFRSIGSIFRRAIKVSRTAILNIREGVARWSPRNYKKFAEETYMKNVIAFRCMDYIGKSVATVPWKLYQKIDDKRETVSDHPINKLLEKPNPNESFNFLMLRYVVFLLISGNSFFEKVAPETGGNSGIPAELYVLRPDKFKINLNEQTGTVQSYTYNNTETFEVDPLTGKGDILHIKLFHPTDDIWGASITESTAREIDSSNEATEFQKKTLENDGKPGMILTIKGQLTPEQFDRYERQLQDNFGGSSNAGKPYILESNYETSITPYSWSPKEMDFIESNRELARRICLGYGVPPMLLGIPGDNTYSNYKEARQAFWEETVLFYLSLARGSLNNWLFEDEEKLFIDYVLDNVPAFEPKRTMLWERAKGASFLTENEKREMVGYQSIDGGDVLLVPINLIPLTSVGTSSDDEKEKEKEKRHLLAEGYSESEINEMLGEIPRRPDA